MKKSGRGMLWYAQQPLPSGGFSVPIRSHKRPSPPTGWQGGGRRSVTGLGNEPGEQPVGGDDGWVSHQVYHCDTHIQHINTHANTEDWMQQRERRRERCQ